jgi:LAO/AO transport system kinase
MSGQDRKPEWVPPGAGREFATSLRKGGSSPHEGGSTGSSPVQRRILSRDEYVRGVRGGDRTVLARAITLVESNAPADAVIAQEVLADLLPSTGNSLRIGITGVPGAGKSTFIEAMGSHLTGVGRRVAVLAVDPTSSITRGSVLGDKTRMEKLARDPQCFIRPSPSGGALGGVARKTRESILVCEAAGYDVVIVETVGVGQNEITVRSMVDFFLVIMITGAGDELQGIKKGVLELADGLVINKADGQNTGLAESMRAEYTRAVHHLLPATEGWATAVRTCSALHGEGIAEIWALMSEFRSLTEASGLFKARRQQQLVAWVDSMVDEHLRQRFMKHPRVRALAATIQQAVIDGRTTAVAAVEELLRAYDEENK